MSSREIRTGLQISLKAGRVWAERAGCQRAGACGELSDARRESFPGAYKELGGDRGEARKHFRDTQDMEFTIERNRLFMLQTRTGKRTAQAAVRIAVGHGR